MSISIDNLSSTIDLTTQNAASSTSSLQKTLEKTQNSSTTATEEELLDACKEFEAYFIEQVIKEVKKTLPESDEEEDSYASSMTDYFMDSTIQDISETIVEQSGGTLANQLYEQMKRNYGIGTAEEV